MYLIRCLGYFLLPLCTLASTTAPATAPQCKDFREFMDTFQSTVKSLIPVGFTMACQLNNYCLGFHCEGSALTKAYRLNLTLFPCPDDGVPYLHFERSGDLGDSVERNVYNGDRQLLLDYKAIRVYVKPTIQRMDRTHVYVAGTLQHCLVAFGVEIVCKSLPIANKSIEVDDCPWTGTQAPPTSPFSRPYTTQPQTAAPPTTAQPHHTTNRQTEPPTTAKPHHTTIGPTPNPECSGMQKLTKDLQQSLEFLKCVEDSNCTGFMCNGMIKSHLLSFHVTLHHCQYQPWLTYTGHGVTSDNKHIALKRDFFDGSSYKIIDFNNLTVTLVTNITRTEYEPARHIRISAHIDVCEFDECLRRKTVVDNLIVDVKPCVHHTDPPTTHKMTGTTADHTTHKMTGTTADYTTHKMTGTTAGYTTRRMTGTTAPPGTTGTHHPTTMLVTTSNPECSGMEQVTEDLQKSLDIIKCVENVQCTGFSCVGGLQGHKFNFNVSLEYCTKKPKLVYSGHGFTPNGEDGDLHEEFYDGDRHNILDFMGQKTALATNIKRVDKGHIKLSCYLFVCEKDGTTCGQRKTVLQDSVITVKPCDHMDAAAHRHQHKPDHRISSGALAGIIISCVVITAALLVGLWFWKKGRHVTRLRAAYYNDISMNDPLYDDFDPVDA